jgi:hypothetical protein
MTLERRNSGERRDGRCESTAEQIRVLGNVYARENRGTIGSGVFYAVRAKAI